MKRNYLTWSSVAAIIITMTAAFWWFTGSQYVDALVGVSSEANTTITSDTNESSGPVKQTDKPVMYPFGDTAGPIVDAHTKTVAEVVAGFGSSEFSQLFAEANGNAQVSGSGQFTVFVPTNGAFTRLPKGTIANMSAEEKVRLVRYHIIKGRALDTDAVMSGSIQTASGDALNVNLGVNSISLVGSAIVVTQYNCKNGVVYTINNVLLPPQR